MKKRKKILNSIITISILIFIISIIFYFVYINSDFFKLKELGYTEKEILDLRKYFNDDKEILESKDKDIIIELIKQKYYIFDNNNKYIEYYNENKDIELSEIISIINTNRDNDFYTNIKDTDIEILDALTALGYSIVEAQAAIQSIPSDFSMELEDRLKAALKYFSWFGSEYPKG